MDNFTAQVLVVTVASILSWLGATLKHVLRGGAERSDVLRILRLLLLVSLFAFAVHAAATDTAPTAEVWVIATVGLLPSVLLLGMAILHRPDDVFVPMPDDATKEMPGISRNREIRDHTVKFVADLGKQAKTMEDWAVALLTVSRPVYPQILAPAYQREWFTRFFARATMLSDEGAFRALNMQMYHEGLARLIYRMYYPLGRLPSRKKNLTGVPRKGLARNLEHHVIAVALMELDSTGFKHLASLPDAERVLEACHRGLMKEVERHRKKLDRAIEDFERAGQQERTPEQVAKEEKRRLEMEDAIRKAGVVVKDLSELVVATKDADAKKEVDKRFKEAREARGSLQRQLQRWNRAVKQRGIPERFQKKLKELTTYQETLTTILHNFEARFFKKGEYELPKYGRKKWVS